MSRDILADDGQSSLSDDDDSFGSRNDGPSDGEEDDDRELGPEIVSLMDATVFSNAETMLADCKQKHGLDFLAIRDRLQLDFHGSVKLINFSEFTRSAASVSW
jgi:hypothetical protein